MLLWFLAVVVAAPRQQSDNRDPVFTEGATATRLLVENAEGGLDIRAPVTATDEDGHRLTYRLTGEDAGSFLLDSRSGQLRTRAGVGYDFETKDAYAVTVTAEDGRGGRGAIAVAVQLTDVAEPPSAPDKPEIVDTGRNTLAVRWTTPANTGPEIREYDGRYRVAGSQDAFESGWERLGVVTETTLVGLEQDTVYEVQVRARNAEGPGEWSESVEGRTNPNQAPVFDEGSTATRSLEENSAAGVDVGSPVSATDGDGDSLFYSLDETSGSSFLIDSGSGQLTTKEGVTYDYETTTSYSLTVKVEDGHDGSATSTVTVNVSDVDDVPVTADAGWDLTVAAGGTAWLDGTASRVLEGDATYSWSFVSWAGTSAPALVDSSTATPSFVAAAEGDYVVRLTVTAGDESDTDEVSVEARPATEAATLLVADLLVDTNRDGTVDSNDETGEDSWTADSGAVFGPNADDDDDDGVRDGWDDQVNGDADLLDMAQVVVRHIPGLHRKHSAVLKMGFTSDSSRPRMFLKHADGTVELLIGGADVEAELPRGLLAAGDLDLRLESPLGRDIGFDGRLALTLSLNEGETETASDEVALRGSPILYSHHLQAVDQVFVVATAPGKPWSNTPLVDALESKLPSSASLHTLAASDYGFDTWIQDTMQTGYVQRPSANGVVTVAVHTQLHRDRGLTPFLTKDYLSAEVGYAYPGGAYYSSYNFGGNVEVIPPHTHDDETYPYGRLVIGGDPDPDTDAMAQKQLDFLNAQEAQGPAIVVDTSWLAVGHVDEVFSIIPNYEAEEGERPWVVLIGSPDLAVDLLEDAADSGGRFARVFQGRGFDQTRVGTLLDDSDLMDSNTDAQAKIDTIRASLVSELGLDSDDFVEVPTLFYEEEDGLMSALMPFMQNLLVADDVLLVPDPEGPDVGGEDVWQQGLLDAVDGLGLTVHFVDVYYSYHIASGGVHCGTNAEHAGSTAAWWLNADTEDSE